MAIVEDAVAVADAGVCAMVVEAVPTEVGRLITERVETPTIGIGAGPECDGQVLVSTDMLGIDSQVSPKFVKRYAELGATIKQAFRQYATEVQAGTFPDETHAFTLKPDVATALRAELGLDSPDAVNHAYPLQTDTAGSNDGRHS
jgi:3-methyl-2-oxobutanoate hydroxymethyltransferase